MTSSTTNASLDSPPLNNSPNDGNNKVDREWDRQEAQDTLSDNTELNTAVDIDTDPNTPSHKNNAHKERAAAKKPDAKIKVQTLGPDVVVATLETDEPDSHHASESVESEALNPTEPFFQKANDAEVVIEAGSQESVDTEDNHGQKEIKPNEQKNINKHEQQVNKQQDTQANGDNIVKNDVKEQQSDQEHQEDQEEEVKEKKKPSLSLISNLLPNSLATRK
ncbi:hypothetical protein [Psychrobacter sp. DAB_AL43B]|uniref:hypothetical protein n=1 Tax=Psychrobacter sp. DAB_AL43B TaxID=1028416 RepID=UPI0009C1CF08|nr:hypothetical protein [Psychrobacter sp. DAB_AL43B]SLJ85104.1 hypothetical protein DABAL43B_1912 [Psychrobacter sp. DAB_AL43B]